jgi:hypothetical protein
MKETPLSAMERFGSEMGSSLTSLFDPMGKTDEQISDETFSLLRPFLANPEGHEKAVRMLLRGFALNWVRLAMEPLFRIIRGPFGKFARTRGQDLFSKARASFLDDLKAVQDDLIRSLTPVELDADVLPLLTKTIEGTPVSPTLRLVVLRTNVSLYSPQFNVQSLSVRVKIANDPDFQFVDVDPSSRTENIGGYELGITDSGKFVQANRESRKLAMTLDGKLAKIEDGAEEEKSSSVESGRSVSAKSTGQYIVPMVISSAIRETARWELLRTPTQTLLGGFAFMATALMPLDSRTLTVDLKVVVELENWGPYEISLQKKIS